MVVHLDSEMLHTSVQFMLCTTLWGAIQTAVYVKGITWYCAVHNLCSHMWWPCINSCGHWFLQISILFWVLSSQSSFQSSFYNISICSIWIICSWCNIPEEGLTGCPSVWEEIQWIKQQEIPMAALVISFAGYPPICWSSFICKVHGPNSIPSLWGFFSPAEEKVL